MRNYLSLFRGHFLLKRLLFWNSYIPTKFQIFSSPMWSLIVCILYYSDLVHLPSFITEPICRTCHVLHQIPLWCTPNFFFFKKPVWSPTLTACVDPLRPASFMNITLQTNLVIEPVEWNRNRQTWLFIVSAVYLTPPKAQRLVFGGVCTNKPLESRLVPLYPFFADVGIF